MAMIEFGSGEDLLEDQVTTPPLQESIAGEQGEGLEEQMLLLGLVGQLLLGPEGQIQGFIKAAFPISQSYPIIQLPEVPVADLGIDRIPEARGDLGHLALGIAHLRGTPEGHSDLLGQRVKALIHIIQSRGDCGEILFVGHRDLEVTGGT